MKENNVKTKQKDDDFDITKTTIKDINKLFYFLKDSGKDELLNKLEKAMICSDVYGDSLDKFLKSIHSTKYVLPKNSYIHRLTDDQLIGKQLNPDMFVNDYSGFFSALYYNNRTQEYILAFRGTEGTEWLKEGKKWEKQPEAVKDWKANMEQLFGIKTVQYTQAMNLAKHVKEHLNDNFSITGHSLGGGLASAASIITQKNGTVTFNSAGLHPMTTYMYNKSNKWYDEKTKTSVKNLITNYFVEGEVLTTSQYFLHWLVAFINDAYPLPAGKTKGMKPAHPSNTLCNYIKYLRL